MLYDVTHNSPGISLTHTQNIPWYGIVIGKIIIKKHRNNFHI